MEDLNHEHIMSIDVEDWYNSSLDLFDDSDVKHGQRPNESVVENTLLSLDMLDRYRSKGTFFVLGTVAEYYPDLVKEIIYRGHEVASHGYAHKLVYNLSPEKFETDIKISMEHLTKAGCNKIIGYRAPYWSITKKSLWALDILKDLGFKYDSSIFPIHRGLYGISDAKPYPHRLPNGMMEFPPATIRLPGFNFPIAGGGYLRLLPSCLLNSMIERASNSGTKVFYFHPYELDANDVKVEHKVTNLKSLIYVFQQRLGRSGNKDKLAGLILKYKFNSFENILGEY